MTAADVYARFDAMREALDELIAADAARRLWDRDATLWSDDADVQAAVSDRLGWLDVAGGRPGWSARLREFADGVKADGIDRVVLAGMGGSSLAPDVFATVFADQRGAELVVLDTTHPQAVREILPEDGLDRTLVIVSSKSGSTAETSAFARRAERLAPSTRHLAAITDPGSDLAEEAVARGWREVFLNPADIGGRYSALSLFGMVPAALIGVDIDAVWRSGARMLTACGPTSRGIDNPAVTLGAFMGGFARAGRDKLTVFSSPTFSSFGGWLEQLVAESTGKMGAGIVPVVGEPIAAPGVYGDDRAFVVIDHPSDPVSGVDDLAAAGMPVLRITVDDRHDLGGEFVRWEAATALAGALIGIDPFDEPNVAESKQNTNDVLAEIADGATLPAPEDGDVEALLSTVQSGDYISFQSYLAPEGKIADGITELRMLLRDHLRVATTAGWGPRFLHSTGQLHKGGPGSVVVIQLVDVPDEELPIPGLGYGFGTLIRAQALGDLRSLRAHDRRVAQRRIDGPEDVVRLIGDVRATLFKPVTGHDAG